MELYISQLISDIHEATWRVKPPHEIWDDADPENEGEMEDLSYLEEYVYGNPEKISSITGINTEFLPPPEKLNDEQAARLALELEKLLNVFHFCLDFPDEFPMHLRYPFIRDMWDEEHVPISFGESHIEFCDYDEEEYCPFEGYCDTCQEFDEEVNDPDSSEELDDEDLPF
jgi:hypothetical protein